MLVGRRREAGSDLLHEVLRHVAAAALGDEELQPPLEVGAVRARGARGEVLVELCGYGGIELPVEVELDLLQHVLAVNP